MTTSEVTSRLVAARRLIAGVMEGEVTPDVLSEVIREPAKYCGLGGIAQNAYRLNKDNFWDEAFQRQLTLVGVYVDRAARELTYVPYNYHDDDRDEDHVKPAENYDGFVELNDHDATTLKDVLKVFRQAVKALKVREAARMP